MIKNLMWVVSTVAMFGMVGCAAEDATAPEETATASEIDSVLTVCWPVSGIHQGACGGVPTGCDLHAGDQVDVTNSPFFSNCDGQNWVHVDTRGCSGDMRWDSFCGH